MFIWHANHIISSSYYIAICDLSRSIMFSHVMPWEWHDFWEKIIGHEMCYDFIYNLCLKPFSFWEEFNDILA